MRTFLFFLFLTCLFPFSALAEVPDYFPQGVASGDPTTDRLTLWTRVETAESSATVNYQVSPDPNFSYLVASGTAIAEKTGDFTVNADISGLKADTTYYYRFFYQDHVSSIGRTKTLPANTRKFRIALLSCQNFSAGWFTAYKHLINDQPDLLIILGDNIYDQTWYGTARQDLPNRNPDLEFYRQKHRLYRSDPYFRAALAKFPVAAIWDDHEVQNNYSGKAMKLADPEKIKSGYQAFFEYLPVRKQTDSRIYRQIKIGQLVEFFLLDGRQYRDQNVCNFNPFNPHCLYLSQAANRQYLGEEQEKWFLENLKATTSTWKIPLNNTLFTSANLFWFPVNYDQWDGFPVARQRIIDFIDREKIKNIIFLTGDLHVFIAAEINYQGKKLAREFVTSAVSSSFRQLMYSVQFLFPVLFPQMNYFNAEHPGYTIVDFQNRQADIYFYGITDIVKPDGQRILKKHFSVKREN